MTTTAQAFLFNADAEGVSSYYGGDFEPAFLGALSTVDQTGITHSTLLRGDVIVRSLCAKVTAVSREPRKSSHTQSYDIDLYQTIIWDLADAFSGQWHTLDLEQFPLILARRRVYSITVAALPIEFRERIDARMRAVPGYLGSVEIDLGNPIQRQLLLSQLVDAAVIAGGQVTMELSWEGFAETTIAGSNQFKPNGDRRVAYGELEALKPSIAFPPTFSPRGQRSADIYEGKRSYTVHDRVLLALSRAWKQAGDSQAYTFGATSEHNFDVMEATLPEEKFVRYLLNPLHDVGRAKAKFFRDELGIGADDWRYLAAQLYAGVKEADLNKIRVKAWTNGYGASFNCLIPVRGLNGRAAMIETNWILKPGLLPQLSTAYPGERDNSAQGVHEQVPIVSSTLAGDARWEAVYRFAHEAGVVAATGCVPTPMKISGGELLMEGSCGNAEVRISDARRGFARWIVRTGKGSKHFRSGASVYADIDSLSYDRAVAYAKAFATVLGLNGINCSIEARYD